MMRGLAKIGFTQSYTYFTWRNTKRELEDYLTELSHETVGLLAAELLRQHPGHPARVPAARRPAGLQDPRSARRDDARRRGASTPATSCSSTCPLRPGSEEYLDSEKYQYRPRDYAAAAAAGRVSPLPHDAQPDPPRAPGAATAAQPALARCSTTTQILAYSKQVVTDDATDTVLVVVNLNPSTSARRRSRSTCRRSASTGEPSST